LALDPSARYSGQIDTSAPEDYPHGKARNRTLPNDGTGTPLERDFVNDIFGLQQALLRYAGITPANTPDTARVSQYLDAIDSMIPKAVDNWDKELYQQPQPGLRTNDGHMFSIGETRLGYPQASGIGGGDGPFIFSEVDYRTNGWESAGSAGIGDWSHPAYGNGFVISFETNGGTEVRKWDTTAQTWSGAGTMAGVAADWIPTVRHHYFATASLWLTILEQGGEHSIYRDADLSGAWTHTSPPAETLTTGRSGATATAAVRDMVSNANVCLIAHQNGYIARSTNGTTWTAVLLPSFTGDIVGLAYNERTELWAVAGTGGKTWYSDDDGATWDAGLTYSWTATAGTRIACLGRHWVLAADDYLYRFNEIGSKLVRETLLFSTTLGVHDVWRHNDQVVISQATSGGSGALLYRFSHRLSA
jgi:hypothetical protein